MMDPILQTELEPLARAHRWWLAWRAMAACWLAAALVGLLLLLLRRVTGWPGAWAGPLLAIVALLVGISLAVRAWGTNPNYRAIARRLEYEQPELHALLLTAVEQQANPATGEFNYLQHRVVSQALERNQQQPWGRSLFNRVVAAQCVHWVAFAALLGVLIGLRQARTPRSYAAGVPAAFGVYVSPGDTNIERGSGLVVLARFAGKLPTDVTLVSHPLNEKVQRIPLTKTLGDPVFGGAVAEIKNDLTYHVEYPKGQTKEFTVRVFDFPRLEHADAKLTYPAYTGLPQKTIPDTRRVSAVEGSTLDYSFFLNKPVSVASMVAKGKPPVTLIKDTNNPAIYHAQFTLRDTARYELSLTDDTGRTNKLPTEFVIGSVTNHAPELKLLAPRGDQRVSPLEEIAFQAQAVDDFGLLKYGIAYSISGQEAKLVTLGTNSGPSEKRLFNYLLPMENLSAQPDQLLSYYLWAEDFGPDGKPRRTTSDMYFAEVRPFDEVFREAQDGGGGEGQGQGEGASPQGNETQKLAELQRQIISATWNLQRRETGAKPSVEYQKDVTVVQESQDKALDQLTQRHQPAQDPRAKAMVDQAEKAMKEASKELSKAASDNALGPLSPALTSEQAAAQALLKLQAREYQVARSRNQKGGGGGGGQRSQRQIDELDLKQTENRYETQRQAATAQNPQQREQLQVLNRLKELAQRQQDLNERLKELQTALQAAKTDAERQEIRDRLKRLREEQRDMLADVDEVRQRMDRSESQSQSAEARQSLEQTRSDVERAAEALDQNQVPQALASGTRAQRELQKLHDDFRKNTSSQFADDMRRMRNEARQLAQQQEEISKKMESLAAPNQHTLNDSAQRDDVAKQLAQQRSTTTNLFNEMRQVSEQAETAEPLLSKQLYDTIRQNNQETINQSLDFSSQLVQRSYLPQARVFNQRAQQGIDELKRGVERAAESVLGDEAQALRLAQQELDDLREQLDKELAGANGATNQAGAQAGGKAGNRGDRGSGASTNETQMAAARSRPGSEGQTGRSNQPGSPQEQGAGQSGQQPGAGQQDGQNQPNGQGQGNGQGQRDGQNQRGGGQRGGAQALASDDANGSPDAQPQGGEGDAAGAQRDQVGLRSGARRAGANRDGGYRDGGDGGGWGGGWDYGPLTGERYADWADRLRDVEEMLDAPDLRTEVARIRDRARAVRLDYKRSSKKPDWAVVRTQISAPLAEVASQVAQRLAQLQSKEALVPIDRDPVPVKFSELVRRYYEQLGKSE